jgi:polysaccharide pyruvyl transferase WcaK-like protein
MLYHLCRLLPDAEVACVCTGPGSIAATYSIEAVQISSRIVKPWNLRNPVARLLRKLFIGVPSELYRWFDVFKMLNGTDMLIIPGTGLLTDAFGLLQWGPYNLFKWTAMAKLRGGKVLFVSVGAGPIRGTLGRFLVKSALSLGDFRSYRDHASLKCVKEIGGLANDDRVYPDLVFSFPEALIPPGEGRRSGRPVVGLGLMEHAGMYLAAGPGSAAYSAYLESLVVFVKWLLTHEHDIRFVIGEGRDRPVIDEFKSLLRMRLGTYDEKRIIDQPISTAQQLLSQLAATDMVVATRFHNVLIALLLNKPVISISFHHKCASLMQEMGLSGYCHDINHLDGEKLIKNFVNLENNAEKLRLMIRQKVEQLRKTLDEQYALIFSGMLGSC